MIDIEMVDQPEAETSQNRTSPGWLEQQDVEPRIQRGESKKLGTLLLATIVFYNVSGGPFGIEESVRSAGNLYTLLGFLIMPLVWSVPEAIITAELGSAFPEPAGGVAWVQEAFGEKAAWMSGFLGWVAGATDNAIYPVLFLDYLGQAFFADNDNVFGSSTWGRFIFVSLTTIVLGYINWRGLKIVGRVSVVIACVALSPFLILIAAGAAKIQPHRWLALPAPAHETDISDGSGGLFPSASLGGVILRPFLNSLFWNLNSFDAAASFSEDVDDISRTFPRAMGWSVLMVAAGYIVPLLIILGASDAAQDDWVDGYIATVASQIVGPWLGAWTVFAAGVSNIALFQAELSADAFQIMGMAERGHLPRIFCERSQYGTPTYGILLGLAVIATVISVSDLEQLIEMLNFNYAISLLMEYAAFLQLRRTRPDMVRPWRFPCGFVGCVIMLVVPCAFTLLTMSLATFETYIFSGVVTSLGFLLYRMRKCWKTNISYDPVNALVTEGRVEHDETSSDSMGETR